MKSLTRKQKPNGSRAKMRSVLVLLAMLLMTMTASSEPLTTEEIDSLLGPRTEFSRQEVAELMSSILTDAEEEIKNTAEDAAREVAVADAGEIAFQKSLAESWKEETQKADKARTRWKNATLIEAAIIIGGALVLGLTR